MSRDSNNVLSGTAPDVDSAQWALLFDAIGIRLEKEYFAEIESIADSEILAAVRRIAEHRKCPIEALAEAERNSITVFRRLPNDLAADPAAIAYLIVGNLPLAPGVTLVSSRLGRNLDQQQYWLDAIRTFCGQMSGNASLWISPGQYTFRFLDRLATSLSIPACIVDQTTPARLKNVIQSAIAKRKIQSGVMQAFVWRVVASEEEYLRADDLVATHCAEVRALHVRRNGNIWCLIDGRLGAARVRPGFRTMILCPRGRKLPQHIAQLMERGAIPWHVFPKSNAVDGPGRTGAIISQGFAKILALKDVETENYVAHFTRRQRDSWLDESEAKYIDALLDSNTGDRSAISTLCRIIAQQQLLANNRLTRDSNRVICFTARRLDEFREMRAFRPHLARWDFEPYGIAIRRDVLRGLGGRPVIYGDESTWLGLAPPDRPFFQLSRGDHTEWTNEAEWRVVGDLDLSRISVDDAVVFVPNQNDAQIVATICRWPIVLMDS